MAKKFRFPPGKLTKSEKMQASLDSANESIAMLRNEIAELRALIEKRQTINLRLRGVPGVRNQTLTHRE